MSSVIFLKKIENYVPEKAIEDFKKAAQKANMFCILIKDKYRDDLFISAKGHYQKLMNLLLKTWIIRTT
ncbi:hypothetical protein [Paenibacillus sp. O199]|uniref:hypothetical protein n=1 Tax=Paenibacillus sp. O199 TaxID=1643925 RepID=UPI0007BFB7B7|nr:hypothetical protein [Paenibacillus sp. O199]